MMRILYFDCFAGASGDMILGAMVAAGVDPSALKEQLTLLPVQGYSIEFQLVDRSGLSATYARVQTPHEQAHRNLSDILKIIDDSRLSDRREVQCGKDLLASHRGRSSRAQRVDRTSPLS